ncbi:MAG: hypothetical protein ABI411_04015 [Tahibacter sp.]
MPRLSSSRQLPFLLAAVLVIGGCARHATSVGIESLAAIKHAESAAIAAGYDVGKFNRDMVACSWQAPCARWMIHYSCKVEGAAPGCGFLVTVDTHTAATEIFGDE